MKEEKTKKEDLKKLKTSEILDYCGKTRDFDMKTDWDTKYAYEGELQNRADEIYILNSTAQKCRIT